MPFIQHAVGSCSTHLRPTMTMQGKCIATQMKIVQDEKLRQPSAHWQSLLGLSQCCSLPCQVPSSSLQATGTRERLIDWHFVMAVSSAVTPCSHRQTLRRPGPHTSADDHTATPRQSRSTQTCSSCPADRCQSPNSPSWVCI